MGSDISSKSTGKAIVVFDERATLWEAQSNATEAEPFAGQATNTNGGNVDLVWGTSGTPIDDTLTHTVGPIRGGYPGTGATWGYKPPATNRWHGWDAPTSVTDAEAITWITTAGVNVRPRPVSLPNGKLLVVYQYNASPLDGVGCAERTAAGVWSSPLSVVTEPFIVTHKTEPCACVVGRSGEERVAFWYVSRDETSGFGQIAMWWADPDDDLNLAASWNWGSDNVLEAAFDYSTEAIKRMAVAARGDQQVLLLIETASGIKQYASSDLGHTFTLVATLTNSKHPTVAVSGGYFVVGYIATDLDVETRRIGSAYSDITVDTAVTLQSVTTSVTITDAFELAVDDRDVLWAYIYDDVALTLRAWKSEDAAATWTGKASAGLLALDADPGQPEYPGVCHHQGRIVLVSTHIGTGSAYDNSLTALWFGGWATMTMPQRDLRHDIARRMTWEQTWVPWTLMANMSQVTETTAGTPGNSITAGFLQNVTTAAGGTEHVTWTMTGAISLDESPVKVRLNVDAGQVAIRSIAGDGSEDYGIEAIVTSSDITFKDLAGGGTLAGPISVSGWVEIILSARTTAPSSGTGIGTAAWAPVTTATEAAHRDYTVEVDGGTLTDGGGAHGTQKVVIVTQDASAACDAEFRMISWLHGSNSGDNERGRGWAAGFDQMTGTGGSRAAPTDLIGKPLSARYQYVANGISARALGGPARPGDEWEITPDHQYTLERVHTRTYRSPRIKWRSLDDTSGMTVAFQLDANDAASTMSRAWGFVAEGNFSDVRFDWHNGTTWVTGTTFTKRPTLVWTREGDIVRPTAGAATSTPYVEEDELVGGYVVLQSSPSYVTRKIVANTAGTLKANSSKGWKATRIRLEGITGSEPTSGISEVWMPRIVGLMWGSDVPATAQGYRFVLEPTTGDKTPEGYYEAKLDAGPMFLLGREWGMSTVSRITPNQTTHVTKDGQRWTTQHGPSEELIEISYAESMIDTTALRGEGQDPDWYPVKQGDTEGDALEAESPYLLRDLMRRLAANGAACLLIPHFDRTGSRNDTLIYQRNRGARLGTLEGEAGIEHRGHGEEEESAIIGMRPIQFRVLV